MRTPEQVSKDIRDYLKVTDPSISAEIGTPERKIIDAVSEVVSNAYLDTAVSTTSWDIDAKTGIELEQLVGLFGFGRLQGKRASGVCTFTLKTPATNTVVIPAGTVVFVLETDTAPRINYQVTVPAFINRNESTTELHVECSVVGTVGNTPAKTVVGYSTSLGVGTLVNANSFTGGVDPETDSELRARFRNTFLRSLVGTEDFYEALIEQLQKVTKVKVVGPISRREVQLQMQNQRVEVPRIDTKYIWPLGDYIKTDEGHLTRGVHYNPEYKVPLIIHAISEQLFPTGTTFSLSYEYVSTKSRNDPAKNVTNKVDVFVEGRDPVSVLDITSVNETSKFTSGESDLLNVKNFVRLGTNTNPKVGSLFSRLGHAPILSLPSTIEVASKEYKLGTHFYPVVSTTVERGSSLEICGIEWLNPPLAGSIFNVEYVYDRTPELAGALLDQNRQITTDVLVHAAQYRSLRANAFIIYETGYDTRTVDASIKKALTDWASKIQFGDWIQLSDIEHCIHGVVGVDAVRIPRASDGVQNYGVQSLFGDKTTIQTFTFDFKLEDDELPRFDDFSFTRKSTNTFGEQ